MNKKSFRFESCTHSSPGTLDMKWNSLTSVSLFISGANKPVESADMRINHNPCISYLGCGPASQVIHKWEVY